MLPSIIALGLVALVALRLTRIRTSDSSLEQARQSASRVLSIMVVIQSVHFAEELKTGFHNAFGPAFGQPPMPVSVFVALNVTLIALWIYSIPGLRKGTTLAFGLSWFLAIAGVMNGVAHPLLAINQGGYFPGLLTAGFVLVAGAFLIRKLMKATTPRAYSV